MFLLTVLLNTMLKHTEIVSEHIRTALLVMAHMAVTQPHIRTLSDKTLKVGPHNTEANSWQADGYMCHWSAA